MTARNRCSVCHAPDDEDHRPDCDAVLARCGHCRVPIVCANARPAPGVETIVCARCRHEMAVPTAFAEIAELEQDAEEANTAARATAQVAACAALRGSK